ncbi:MAG: CHAT domain-containing protein [Chloroflexales bacterium]|nr:CHAT domain-containing protein [Chloroflexales bacterium]
MLTADLSLPPAVDRVFAWSEQSPSYAIAAASRLAAVAPPELAQLALGWALLCGERIAAARPLLEAALVSLDDPPQRLLCRLGLLILDLSTLARPHLDEDFAALAIACDEAGAARLAAWTRLEQARRLNVLGRPREAAALLELIAPALERSWPLGAGRWRRAMAVSAYFQGDYARAGALLTEAEELFRPRRYLLDRARCWFERAVIALSQEQLAEAGVLYGYADRVARRADLPLRRAYCLRGAGLVALRQGRYDLALRQTLDAAALFGELRRPYDVAVCAVHRGNIHLHTGRLQAALAAYTRAEELFAASGYLGDRAIVRRNSAMVLRAQGRTGEAWQLLEAVEREAAAIGFRAEVAEALSAQATVLADEGRLAEADARFAAAHEAFTALGNVAAAAECWLEQGWLALRRGDAQAAEALLAPAAGTLAGRPHHVWRAIYGLGRCAELRGDAEAAFAFYLTASASVAGLRRRLASEAASSGLYTQAGELFADALRLAAARREPGALLAVIEGQRALTLRRLLTLAIPEAAGPTASVVGEVRRRIGALAGAGGPSGEELDQALEEYDEQVLGARHAASALPALDSITPHEALDLAAVRGALHSAVGGDWTVVVYSFAGGLLHRITLTDDQIVSDATPDDEALRRLVAHASQAAYRRYTYADVPLAQGLTSRPWQRLEELAERLLPAALRARLHPGHRLLVVPAGPLHALPWAALRVGGGWLAERALLHVLPALSVVPLLAGRRSGGGALLVGCRDFGGRAPELPGVAHELAVVAPRCPGPVRQLDDARATRADLMAALAEGPALLHIASHARLLPARGLAAHIKLSDEDLLLPEVASLGLAGSVVVLSTCDGAAAEVLPGEEVLSLSWAFLAGGASGVIASLWPIGDGATATVMATLYDGLGAGHDPALALALAQRRLIAGGGPGEVPPQLWGSFVAVGR